MIRIIKAKKFRITWFNTMDWEAFPLQSWYFHYKRHDFFGRRVYELFIFGLGFGIAIKGKRKNKKNGNK